jgi:hypothetical protein
LRRLKSSKKKVMLIAVLIPITAFLTYYTARAHHVASKVIEYGGNLYWPTLSEYTFLPWPKASIWGFTALAPLSQTDVQYYNYIIKSGVLIALTFLFWIGDAWVAWGLMRNQFTNKQITHND